MQILKLHHHTKNPFNLIKPISTTSTTTPPPPQPPPLTPTTVANLVLTTQNPTHLTQTLSKIQFSTTLVNSTLKQLWNHAPKALQFFNTLDNHPNYSHSLSSFHLAIDISARIRNFSLVWTLLTRLQRRGLDPNSLTYSIILERYISSGKPDKAVNLFLSLNSSKFEHDLSSFNDLLDMLCKSRRVDKAVEIMKLFSCRRNGFKFDVISYNIIANGWCLVKRTNKALGVLKLMIERGIDPNLSTFNVMLKGFFRTGQIKEAWEFFKEMKRRGIEVDVVTYSTLIHGFGVVGEVEKAKKLFREMVDEGVLPNVATYNGLIQVLCMKDSVENAIGVYEEMVRKGYVPNGVTYNLLIRGLCHEGEMGRAEEFVEVMRKEGCEPNVQTFNLLIRYNCEVGEIEKGLELFGKMGVEECLPNLDTYNVLIKAMFVRKKSEDLVVAGKLLVEMVDRGFLPTKFCFDRVLNGLLVTGNQEFAREILRLQSKCGVLPRHFRL